MIANNNDNDVRELMLASSVNDVAFSVSQIPNAVYYNGYLRYGLALLAVVGKIIQAAGQNIIGVTKSLAMVREINFGSVEFITIVLTCINIIVNLSTRADSIFKGLALNKIYLVENLASENLTDIPKDSYVVTLKEISTQPLYQMDATQKLKVVALTGPGKEKLWDFYTSLNTYFTKKQKSFPEGKTSYLISEELAHLAPDTLALFSQVINNRQKDDAYESYTASGIFAICYAVCCFSMLFAGVSAEVSSGALVERFAPGMSELGADAVGFYVLTCSTMSYYFFNLTKMHKNVSDFCGGIDAALSSRFDLIELKDAINVPEDAVRGEVFIKINQGLDQGLDQGLEASFDYLIYGMDKWGTIKQSELNCGNSAKDWCINTLNQPEIKKIIAALIVQHGHTPYQGSGINISAMWSTLVASLFGVVAGCGMAYLMMIKGEEKIVLLKDLSAFIKEFLALSNVAVSIFPSFFNFAFSAYGLFATAFPEKEWIAPVTRDIEAGTANSDKILSASNTVAKPVSMWQGNVLTVLILIDALSNSFGSLMGMLLLVDSYLKPSNLVEIVFSDILVACSFIDNVIMNFAFALRGSENVIVNLNKRSVNDKLQDLRIKLIAIKDKWYASSIYVLSSCSSKGYQAVTNEEPATNHDNDTCVARTRPNPIVFDLGDRPDLNSRVTRHSASNHVEFVTTPGRSSFQVLKSQERFIVTKGEIDHDKLRKHCTVDNTLIFE